MTEQTILWLRQAALEFHQATCDELYDSLSLSQFRTFSGSMRLTEQGEVLAKRYDDPVIAHRHLE